MLRITLAVAALVLVAPAFAQPSGASPAAEAAPAVSAATKQCDTAQRRVTKEERSLSLAVDEIALDRKGKESCATAGACARYDAAIKSMEARKARHETRLAKFKSDAERICKPD